MKKISAKKKKEISEDKTVMTSHQSVNQSGHDESLCRLKTRKREFYDNVLVCYQQEIFFVHFRFFLTYKCETLNIRNICPQGARKEKQKLKVKNTKNKFLIIFKFSSREKKKILTGRKT